MAEFNKAELIAQIQRLERREKDQRLTAWVLATPADTADATAELASFTAATVARSMVRASMSAPNAWGDAR